MRKYKGFIIGLVTGGLMTASVGTYAATSSNVGKRVQGEVTVIVDGSALPQKAIIIDGSSYAPLRSVGDSTGYDVGFKDKRVTFTKKESNIVGTETNELDTINARILEIAAQLKSYSEERGKLDAEWRANPDKQTEINEKIKSLDAQYDPIAQELKVLQNRRDELQKQLQSNPAAGAKVDPIILNANDVVLSGE